MVARTASLYIVGRWGVGNTAVGGAEGGIVKAEALSSSSARISSPNAAQLPKPSSMAWILAMTASTRAKRGAAYASNCHATLLLSSLCSSLASAFVAKVVARSANSWQRCTLVALLANALSRAAAWGRSLASAARPLDVACWPHWPMLSPAWPSCGDVAPRRVPSWPTSQPVLPPHGNVAPWRAQIPPMPQRAF